MRCLVMLPTIPLITLLMVNGTLKLAAADPDFPKAQKNLMKLGFWREWASASGQELLPPMTWFITTSGSFFKPNYHPIYEASTETALEYINNSPAVKAFQQHGVS